MNRFTNQGLDPVVPNGLNRAPILQSVVRNQLPPLQPVEQSNEVRELAFREDGVLDHVGALAYPPDDYLMKEFMEQGDRRKKRKRKREDNEQFEKIQKRHFGDGDGSNLGGGAGLLGGGGFGAALMDF